MRYQFSALRRSSQIVAAAAALAVVTSPISVVAPAQAKAPSGLKVSMLNSSTPVLSWNRVTGATEYQVQVDNDSGFSSPEVTTTTKNSRYVPTVNLARGTQHWRVTPVKKGSPPSWASGSFSVAAVDVPVPTTPANGATLPQPSQPPLLRWQTSRGATSYIVEVDGDSDFIGATSYTTRTTSLALPKALPAGDYFWRVTASLGQGLNSVPSNTSTFVLAPLAAPTLTYPVDDINSAVEDVVFDWEPVPGAVTYDLQVATDSTFNNFAYKAENLYGSRFSPPTTLFNDQFWWRVRAVDLAGQPTEWAATTFSFKRQWLDTPQAVYPTGSTAVADASVVPADGNDLFYQWTPVQHATSYELVISSNVNFSGTTCFVQVAGTTYSPRQNGCGDSTGTVLYWHVRPSDFPYPNGLPGIYSPTQKIKFSTPTPPGAFTEFQTVTGLKVAMTGSGAASGSTGCAAVQCDGLTATPVLKWDRMPGINLYRVIIANDENFTTSPVPALGNNLTRNTYFTLHYTDQRKALAESEAGKPFFWYVIPCVTAISCGPSPVSQNPPLAGAHSFQKRSPEVTGMTASDPSGSEISFSWQDYFDTNQATSAFGELGQQSARTYRIQVDTEPSFASPLLTDTEIDQATYTAGNELYPEGALYWRVQAVDAQENGLTWSPPQSIIKSSPAVALRAPVGNAAVAGTVPFEWEPQGFASAYTVEVYKNNDSAFSPANRILSATVANPAYTPSDPIPASATPYVWRVRRLDSSKNPGAWSTGSFVSLGSVPELLAPANGSLLGTFSGYFEWSDVPGAARYDLTMRSEEGGNQVIGTVATAATPSELKTGTYTWTVTAYDAAGKALGTSPSRSFRVDATAPKVLKVKPKKVKAKSDIKVLFSEPVKGASKKTVKLMRANSKGKFKIAVKAKVKVKQGGKMAVIDPKGSLKKGSYQIVFKNSAIKDGAGNLLVDKSVKAPSL